MSRLRVGYKQHCVIRALIRTWEGGAVIHTNDKNDSKTRLEPVMNETIQPPLQDESIHQPTSGTAKGELQKQRKAFRSSEIFASKANLVENYEHDLEDDERIKRGRGGGNCRRLTIALPSLRRDSPSINVESCSHQKCTRYDVEAH